MNDQDSSATRSTGMENAPSNPARRHMLLRTGLGIAAAATAGVAGLRWIQPAQAATAGMGPDTPGTVHVVLFDDNGKRVGDRAVPRVVKTVAQWKQQLSSSAFHILRQSGTEYPFSGNYNKPKQAGFYRCMGCGNAVYNADTQFHSGTGWPSFWQPIAAENVSHVSDDSYGMSRTAIACTECGGHLGHVFDDGPQPTGLRFCMNSVALRFIPTPAA